MQYPSQGQAFHTLRTQKHKTQNSCYSVKLMEIPGHSSADDIHRPRCQREIDSQ